MNYKWTLKDIVDLEYLLEKDDQPAEIRHERDRNFFLKSMEAELPPSPEGKDILRLWLEKKRDTLPPTMPGQIFSESFTLIRLAVLIGAFITGSALAGFFLRYDGTTPVNIFTFLGGLLLPQTFFLLLLFINTLSVKAGILPHTRTTLNSLARKGIAALMIRLRKNSLEKLSAETRLNSGVMAAKIKTATETYSSLVTIVVFNLFQLFAVIFNLTAITTLFLRVIGTDIAFGWQSTLQVSSSLLHKICTVIALPWSWLTSIHTPGLAEIDGSRIILKEGAYLLNTPDLVSWWPFLLMALTVYGLLPRIILLFGGTITQKRRLLQFQFDQLHHRELLHRLTEPYISTRAQTPADKQKAVPANKSAEKPLQLEREQVIVLIPDEIYKDCSTDDLAENLRPLQLSVSSTVKIQMDTAVDLPEIEKTIDGEQHGVFILLESWMPPIMASLLYISAIRKTVPEKQWLHIGLLGKPAKKTIFTPPTEQACKIWQAKIGEIKGKKITVTPLGTNHKEEE